MELGWTLSPSTGSSIDNWRKEGGALLRSLSIFMAFYRPHQQRARRGGLHTIGWCILTRWRTLWFVTLLSLIVRIVMKGSRTPPCMLPQSSYLICITQIDCRGSIDSPVEEIYLVGVARVPACHHGWLAMVLSYDLQLVPSCGCTSFELVCHKHDMLFLSDISYIKELFKFIDLV